MPKAAKDPKYKNPSPIEQIQPVLDRIPGGELTQAFNYTWWLWLFCEKYPLDMAYWKPPPDESLGMLILYLNGIINGEQWKRVQGEAYKENETRDRRRERDVMRNRKKAWNRFSRARTRYRLSH